MVTEESFAGTKTANARTKIPTAKNNIETLNITLISNKIIKSPRFLKYDYDHKIV